MTFKLVLNFTGLFLEVKKAKKMAFSYETENYSPLESKNCIGIIEDGICLANSLLLLIIFDLDRIELGFHISG